VGVVDLGANHDPGPPGLRRRRHTYPGQPRREIGRGFSPRPKPDRRKHRKYGGRRHRGCSQRNRPHSTKRGCTPSVRGCLCSRARQSMPSAKVCFQPTSPPVGDTPRRELQRQDRRGRWQRRAPRDAGANRARRGPVRALPAKAVVQGRPVHRPCSSGHRPPGRCDRKTSHAPDSASRRPGTFAPCPQTPIAQLLQAGSKRAGRAA